MLLNKHAILDHNINLNKFDYSEQLKLVDVPGEHAME